MSSPCPRVRSIAFLLALLALSFGLSGCASDGASQDKPVEKAAKAPPAPPVAAMTIQRSNIPLDLSFMGQTAGSREVEVRARVGGILLRRAYVEGGPVRRGDLMFEIDPAPYEAALAQAKGALGQAEAKYIQAQRDLGRMEKLFKDDVVAKKDIDDANTTLESTKAAVEEARGKLREAELNLEWTRVVAPISGQTSREARSEGSLITTADSLLTTMRKVDPVYVNFSMSGQELQNLRRLRAEGKVAVSGDGQYVVKLIEPDGTQYERTGAINFTDTQVDESTGVVKLRASFPNPDSQILPGQFVRVRLEGAYYADAIAIPQNAVLNTQQGAMVWALTPENMVAPRMVTLGDQAGDNYLVEKGLEPGERIVTEGVITVRPQMTVQVRGEESAPAPDAAAAPAETAKKTERAAQAGQTAKTEEEPRS